LGWWGRKSLSMSLAPFPLKIRKQGNAYLHRVVEKDGNTILIACGGRVIENTRASDNETIL
jgi:hypothetical protein